MIKFELPRDTYTPIKLIGHLTVQDVLRTVIPTVILGVFFHQPTKLAPALLGVTTGLIIGIAWILLRIEGETVDTHLYNLARQRLENRVIQDADIEQIGEKAAVTEDGSAIAVVKVQPVSLTMQDENQQRALHSILTELYDSISFPIELHSRQLPLRLDSYIKQLENQHHNSQLATEYIEFCKEFNHGDNSTTHHYVVVRTHQPHISHLHELLYNLRNHHQFIDKQLARINSYLPFDTEKPPSTEPQLGELDHRARLVSDTLNRGTLEADRLTGIELQQYVQSFNQQRIETSRSTYQIPGVQIGEYRKPLYIDEFPSNAHLGWTVDLLNQGSSGRIDLIQRIEPKNQAKAVRTLEQNIQRLEAEVNSRIGGGLIKDITELQTKRNDAEQMLELCAENSQTLVDYSAYVIAHGTTIEERDYAYTEASTRLDTLLADTKQPLYRTDQAYQTESILHGDGLHEPTLMPSSSAASGFPFATSNRNEGKGVIYGISTEDRSPVLLDQWSWSSYATAVLGKTGSGKSYFVKTLLLRWNLAYTDTRFIVVDPKNEYGNIIQELGGTLTQARYGYPSLKDNITGIQVCERGQEENTDQLIELTQDLYTTTSQDKKQTIVIIDEAHNILRKQNGRRALERFVREARDTNTAVVMISQNASDFTSNVEGRNILKNTEATFLMRHSDVADDVVDFFQLSNTEQSELEKLKTGNQGSYSEALMKISDRLNTKIRVKATDTEHRLIENQISREADNR